MNTGAKQLGRLGLLAVIAGLGALCAWLADWHDVAHSVPYILIASGLLCFGLFCAVAQINVEEAKRHWRLIFIAVTFGVVAKYLIIFAAAFLVTRDWRYAVLGMAVAQIDPLSVAALQGDTRMSEGTKTILNMWASADDPVTALMTPFMLGFFTKMAHTEIGTADDWGDVLLKIAPYAAALIVVLALSFWRKYRAGASQFAMRFNDSERAKNGAAALTGIVTVPTRLYSIAALAGWFIRPAWVSSRFGQLALDTALYGATLLLGVLLAGGVDVTGGFILGVATYSSQIIVAWVVIFFASKMGKNAQRLPRRDVWQLALAQQNGITAIVLALNLEPFLSGTVAAVSLAIVVINLLNFFANELFERFYKRSPA